MAKKHIITLGGFPGSGKSTVKKLLGTRLGYTTFSTGDFTRRLAHERGITLEEFNEQIANGGKELDHLIDEELMRIEREADTYVIDSHLAFHFVPSAFSVYLDISFDTAAERIFNDRDAEIRVLSGDTMHTLEEARERTMKRVLNHKDRYMRHYGINPYLPSEHKHVINTETLIPQEIVEEILIAYNDWLGA
jgi:cytidylate kinase